MIKAYKDIVDARIGEVLLSPAAMKAFGLVREHVKLGCLSDSDGIPLYSERSKSSSGLSYFHCVRGTNNTEVSGTCLPGNRWLDCLECISYSSGNISFMNSSHGRGCTFWAKGFSLVELFERGTTGLYFFVDCLFQDGCIEMMVWLHETRFLEAMFRVGY